MSDNNLPTTINFADPKMVMTLKATVAQGASDQEFALFANFCQSTGLNPFKKEVWFIKAGGRVQLMTGINGFFAIANKHPQYDGMEVDISCDSAGNPVKATAKVYRKDRRFPSVGIALMKEYRKDTPIWKTMPSVMLTKVAKSIALREAFPQELNGVYSEEEMPPEFSAANIVRETVAERPLPAQSQQETVIQEAAEARQYHYQLDAKDVASRNKLKAIRNEGGTYQYDGDSKLWTTDRKVDGLDRYLVDEPEQEQEDNLPEEWDRGEGDSYDELTQQVGLKL